MILPGIGGLAGRSRRSAVWKFNPNDKAAGITLSNGDLQVAMSSSYQSVRLVSPVPDGKYLYFEVRFLSGSRLCFGFTSPAMPLNVNPETSKDAAFYETSNGYVWNSASAMQGKYNPPIQSNPGDVIGILINSVARYGYFSVNGVWYKGGSPNTAPTPANPTWGAAIDLLPGAVPFIGSASGSGSALANFGASPFVRSPPPGFFPANQA